MRSVLTVFVFGVPCLLVVMCLRVSGQSPELSQGLSWTPPGVTLEGVIVASKPEYSVALVRKQGARRGRSVQVGNTVYGLTLVEVSEEAALFDLGGRQIWLFLDGSAVVPSPAIANLDGPVGDAPSDTVLETEADADGESAREKWIVRGIERKVLENCLAREIAANLDETVLVPRNEDESPGLQIQHLPEGTFLSEIGLLPGDVLLSINGVTIDSLSVITGLYAGLGSEDEIQIELDRRGQSMKIVVNVH